MKKWVIAALLLVPEILACVVPQDGMRIVESMTVCSDVYYFDKGITIEGNDIVLDCDGAVLKSWKGTKGIIIENSTNVTVKGCRILNYNVGIYVRNASSINLDDNHLVRNQIGTRFVVVSKSATFNHDVSLQSPFELIESENNAISLTNKEVEGAFCTANFCNQSKNAITTFLAPKLSKEAMQGWFQSKLGVKSKGRLKAWILEGIL